MKTDIGAVNQDNAAGTSAKGKPRSTVGVKHVVTTASQRAVAYITGGCALLIVAVAAVAAMVYAVHHRMETVNNLASSTLSGVGMAIGGCLGSALILRFKAARSYIRSVLKDLQ